MRYNEPNQADSEVNFKPRYDNYSGGAWAAPAKGLYFENPSPVNSRTFFKIAHSSAEAIEKALDAAHAAKDAWDRTAGPR